MGESGRLCGPRGEVQIVQAKCLGQRERHGLVAVAALSCSRTMSLLMVSTMSLYTTCLPHTQPNASAHPFIPLTTSTPFNPSIPPYPLQPPTSASYPHKLFAVSPPL